MRPLLAGLTMTAAVFAAGAAWAQAAAQRVTFPSADGKTQLVGYLFLPAGPGRHPAVVMMHGRSGAYSANAKGIYSAATLRGRDVAWARRLNEKGYAAISVDSFGPRGYPAGFAAGTHAGRPASINEVTVRPFDAYGAFDYLTARPDITAGRIALFGWSNGASAALATIATDGVASKGRTAPGKGFVGALAFYPGCGLDGRFDKSGYRAYAPTRIFIGTADEEVSPAACRKLAAGAAKLNRNLTLTVYPGATHDFDDPLNGRQDLKANAAANADATAKALAFLAARLGS